MNQILVDLEDRFLRYVAIDTQSNEASETIPSTEKQLELLKLLKDELGNIGAADIVLADYGCLFATIPATVRSHQTLTIAFLAHVDTAPAFSGTNVQPILHRQYDGTPIVLPDDPTQILSPETIPLLGDKLGEDIVTASGTTLLGADDKAGVAIIMTLASHLLANPDIPHGDIRICFTTDEEIGRGVKYLKLEDLRSDVAYTLDGGPTGEVVYETFSANKALVKIKGVSAHPGSAKGVMVNALHLAAKLVDLLPQGTRTPETTDGREGFIHLYEFNGSAAEAELHFILRDFEMDGLHAHGHLLESLCQAIQTLESRAQIECTITPQYRNMRYWLEKDMRPVELAIQAIEEARLRPKTIPIRGGTDGSGLTEMGIPTPNLFTGMQNIHGPLEWISLQDMSKAVEVCQKLVELWANEQSH